MTVYFALEENTGRIKIGYSESDDPQRDRIDPSLTMTSSDVLVVALVKGAGPSVEKLLHRSFEDDRFYRADGSITEFFNPRSDLWSLIGFVQRTGQLPCPPAGCAGLRWVPA